MTRINFFFIASNTSHRKNRTLLKLPFLPVKEIQHYIYNCFEKGNHEACIRSCSTRTQFKIAPPPHSQKNHFAKITTVYWFWTIYRALLKKCLLYPVHEDFHPSRINVFFFFSAVPLELYKKKKTFSSAQRTNNWIEICNVIIHIT